MAVFDFLKRKVNQDAAPAERRLNQRVRASLGARVLVVDDSPTIRAVLGKMLVQDGYEVLKAADGESAVAMSQKETPDLIFLDIVLPGISGFAVLRALRRDSRTRMTPIIMMSGNQQATEQFYVQRFGADGFVKKPFGRVDVFQAIRTLVQAGRMPERVEPAPTDVVPEGISLEEWNAIPEIGMPDPAHVAAASQPLEPLAPPAPAQVRTEVLPSRAAVREWSIAVVSLPMRPTIGVISQNRSASVPSRAQNDDFSVSDRSAASEDSAQTADAEGDSSGH